MSNKNIVLKNLLKEFADHINEVCPETVEQVILYGSRARGDHRPDSDIDVLILVKDKNKVNRDKIYDFVIDAELEHDIDISVNIYETAQFEKLALLKAPFASNVTREGETIWTV